jgi:hypothetical protein
MQQSKQIKDNNNMNNNDNIKWDSYDSSSKDTNTSHNTWAGFWMIVFIISAIMACWGTPDLIDAWIYYLSDGALQ